MLVILKENVENLGNIGDLVKVSDGYARNYLLPRNLVASADENNVAQIENHKKALEKKRQALMNDAKSLATKVAEFACNISRKVHENDKLFGSVTSQDIADVLKKAGFNVEKRQIHIPAPIRSLGVHPVTIKLAAEVSTTMKVWVVKEA